MTAADPPGLDLARLREHLHGHLPGFVTGDLTAQLVVGGRSNLTYLIGDGTGRWILRRPPLGHVLATAHDMGREYRVLTALARSAVPVPRTHLLCTDPDVIGAPFYVMEFVDGTVFRSAAQARRLGADRAGRLATDLVRVLTRLHGLDPAACGLADFGRPEGFLARQLRRWHAQLEASRSREVPGVDDLHAMLSARMPASQRATVVHGDYRLENVVVGAGDTVAAVLDWEMSTLGDPLTDLGLLHLYWTGSTLQDLAAAPAADTGLTPVDAMVAAYAADSDLDLAPLPWYVAFAHFKLAVILEGIHYRHATGKTLGEGFDRIGEVVAPLVARGLDTIRRW